MRAQPGKCLVLNISKYFSYLVLKLLKRYISGTTITSSIPQTLLDIIFDSTLNFEHHLNSICNKVAEKLMHLVALPINACLWVNVEL